MSRMEKPFRSWRLYSCRRLMCTSKMKWGSTTTPSLSRSTFESCCFLVNFTWLNLEMSSSSMTGFKTWSQSSWVRKPGLTYSSRSRVSSGLESPSHRRGVMPLVLFWNFSGKTAYQSRKTWCLRISVWILATPLTAVER